MCMSNLFARTVATKQACKPAGVIFRIRTAKLHVLATQQARNCSTVFASASPSVALQGRSAFSWNFNGWPDCYLAPNDPPGELLHIVLTLVRAKLLNVGQLVSVVGSMTVLNFLTALSPAAIHFFDMNPCAVAWGKMLCELISVSESPQVFISRLFARDVRVFEEEHGKLVCFNQEQFLQEPPSWKWRWESEELLSKESREVYQTVLCPYQEGLSRIGWNTPRILPCEDRRLLRNSTRSGLGSQGRLPEDGFASYLYGEGWLASEWTYQQVQLRLQQVPITWTSGIDFVKARAEDMILDQCRHAKDSTGNTTLLFLMDMFSSGFAGSWPAKEVLRMQELAGRLVVIQSITEQKSELVQEPTCGLDGSLRWVSLSDWQSMALMPPHLFHVGDKLLPGCRPAGLSGEMLRLHHPLRAQTATEPLLERLLDELTTDTVSIHI